MYIFRSMNCAGASSWRDFDLRVFLGIHRGVFPGVHSSQSSEWRTFRDLLACKVMIALQCFAIELSPRRRVRGDGRTSGRGSYRAASRLGRGRPEYRGTAVSISLAGPPPVGGKHDAEGTARPFASAERAFKRSVHATGESPGKGLEEPPPLF